MSDIVPPFFVEQRLTADKILAAFDASNRQALLRAQMQSGKTGIFLYVAFHMLHTQKVKRVVILCGSNETELHTQLMASRNERLKAFVASLVGYPEYLKDAVSALLRERVEVYKSSDLHAIPAITTDTLMIWDESHFAQSKECLPFQFLTRCGLRVSGNATSDAMWATKRSYFLSVSATPFAEFSDAAHEDYKASVTRTIINHVPSPLYRGVNYYSERGLIRKSYSLKTNPQDFTALLAERAGQPKYALVRSRNLDVVRSCCAGAGVAFKEYHSGGKDIVDLDSLKTAPDCFTVIGIKGMCRMGKVVPSAHISFAFEEAKSSKADCVLQSFLGRLCGHGPFPAEDPLLFVAESFLKKSPKTGWSDLDRYLMFAAGEAVLPKSGSCMAKGPAVSGRFVLPPVFVPVMDEDEDDFGEASNLGAMTDAQKRTACTRLALRYVEENPYEDEVQQEEVLRLLEEGGCLGARGFNAKSYDDIRARLVDCHTAGKRFDDDWRAGESFHAYWKEDGSGFYLVGKTEFATRETELACKGAVAPTTGKEAFSAKHDVIVTAAGGAGGAGGSSAAAAGASLMIVKRPEDLVLPKTPGLYTVFVHKSLCSRVKDWPVTKGRGGRNWPRGEVGRDEFERFLVLIEIRMTVMAY